MPRDVLGALSRMMSAWWQPTMASSGRPQPSRADETKARTINVLWATKVLRFGTIDICLSSSSRISADCNAHPLHDLLYPKRFRWEYQSSTNRAEGTLADQKPQCKKEKKKRAWQDGVCLGASQLCSCGEAGLDMALSGIQNSCCDTRF